MKRILLYAALAVIAGLFFVNLYNSLVDVPNWQRDIPTSIQQVRSYMATATPANFFRPFAPVAQVLTLLGLILFWKRGPSFRLPWGAALVLVLLGDALTFGYFYPRNAIIFYNDMAGHTAEIQSAVDQWAAMNWVRSAIVLGALIGACIGLHRTYADRMR